MHQLHKWSSWQNSSVINIVISEIAPAITRKSYLSAARHITAQKRLWSSHIMSFESLQWLFE
ncbi:hypothetical protein ABTE19_22570, partial [Acinetobacter baumannii]